MPDNERIEYLMLEQKKSEYGVSFYDKLLRELKKYIDPISYELAKAKSYNKHIIDWPAGVDFQTTIIGESGKKMNVMFSELERLKTNIEDAQLNVSMAIERQWRKEQKNNTNDESAKLKGLQCLDKYKTVDLQFIYSKLMKLGKLHQSVNETNFVGAFQGATLPEKIHWKGSNPQLATLVYILTGETPEPLLINKLFKTVKEYDSQSTKRIVNKIIKELINAALK
ncbi:MAG: hypothetical protein WCN92_07080 [Eubacteriales bacterium]